MSNLVTNFEGFKIGDVLKCNAGGTYCVVAINAKLDRTLLVKCDTTELFYVGAWGLQYSEKDGEYWWSQGHYFQDDLKGAIDYIINEQPKAKKVWLIHVDWTIDTGEHSSDAYVYATYEIAKREFDKLVREDKEVNYEGYDNEDSPYEWEDEETYWGIWESGCYSDNHSEIKIEEHIIEEGNR